MVLRGAIGRIGLKAGSFRVGDRTGHALVEKHQDIADHDTAFDLLFQWLGEFLPDLSLDAVGHRVVHGGARFVQPHIVTGDVIASLAQLIPLAPDHLPHELKAIRAMERWSYPGLVQIVCFDTAFHQYMPRVARLYPLPRFLEQEGVQRYGFHGLSYEYVMSELDREAGREAATGRVIAAHLGNGVSMAAVNEGRGVETTMGFTPAGGLMMGTRPGDLDPGVVLYLLEEKHLRPSTVNEMLNRHSGLLAVSGITSDMQELLKLEATEKHAAEAIALFCYQARKFAGALAAVLGGVDIIVFTGGIGENAPAIRERICEGLEFLGVEIDGAANSANRNIISRPGSPVTVRVIKTDEELMIARHTYRLVRGISGTPLADRQRKEKIETP